MNKPLFLFALCCGILGITVGLVGLAYAQQTLYPNVLVGLDPQDLKDAKRFYLKFADVIEACNLRGFDNEQINQMCTDVNVDFAKVMRPFFANHSEEIDYILYN